MASSTSTSSGPKLTRIERTRALLRDRRLAGLVVASSGHDDPLLAPFVRAVRSPAPVMDDGAGARSRSETVGAARFGEAYLFLGLEGPVRVMPKSPWELGEVARAGFLPVDGRVVAGSESRSQASRCLMLATSCGVKAGLIGVAGAFPMGALDDFEKEAAAERCFPDLRLCCADDIPPIVRREKMSAEVAEIERVAGASDSAFRAVAQLLAAAVLDGQEVWHGGCPLTVGRVRASVRTVLQRQGLAEPEGNLVAAGPLAAEPHYVGDDQRRITVGESIVVDLFPKGELFSDCTRTFCVGPASRRCPGLTEAAAQVAGVKVLVEGALGQSLERTGRARAYELHKEACAEFRRHGWETQLDGNLDGGVIDKGYIHGLGHGVGDELHEAPTFSKEGNGKPTGEIVVGDVITIEPGLYRPSDWGIRYEDLYVVEGGSGGTAGLRKLTMLPWALDPKEFLARAGGAC